MGGRRRSTWRKKGCRAALAAVLLLPACVPVLPGGATEVADAPRMPIDGRTRIMPGNLISFGPLTAGQVVRIEVAGQNVDAVLVLLRDGESVTATIAGGGAAGEAFDYRVRRDGEYLLYALLKTENLTPAAGRLTVRASPGDPVYQPPARQAVRVVFEPAFLTEPGLVDPTTFTPEQVQLIADLEASVREGVLVELRRIFEGTPIDILAAADPQPTGPSSTLTYTPQRMPAEPGETFDAALPGVEPGSPCAAEAVIFGELLPRGVEVDPGNRNPSDEAVVYVGSFQGRGAECHTAVLNSLNNIILSLAYTGAHEIGHLVGLYHTALVDIMDRRPTVAFQRDLGFARGQVLIEIDTPASGGITQVETRVLTFIYQDPEVYFQTAFGE